MVIVVVIKGAVGEYVAKVHGATVGNDHPDDATSHFGLGLGNIAESCLLWGFIDARVPSLLYISTWGIIGVVLQVEDHGVFQ